MKKKTIWIAVIVGIFLIYPLYLFAAGDCDITRDPDRACLYDKYEFSGSMEGMVLLTFLVPSRTLAERGIYGVTFDITKLVFEGHYLENRDKVSEYLITIIAHPDFVFQFELRKPELEKIWKAFPGNKGEKFI